MLNGFHAPGIGLLSVRGSVGPLTTSLASEAGVHAVVAGGGPAPAGCPSTSSRSPRHRGSRLRQACRELQRLRESLAFCLVKGCPKSLLPFAAGPAATMADEPPSEPAVVEPAAERCQPTPPLA